MVQVVVHVGMADLFQTRTTAVIIALFTVHLLIALPVTPLILPFYIRRLKLSGEETHKQNHF